MSSITPPRLPLPAVVAARLFRVDRPLLVQRYRDALKRACGRTTQLETFHVDAAGYSPEVAAELSDPVYLGAGLAHPSFIVLTVDQVDAPLLQPNAGFAGLPYREWIKQSRAELADLTLREPVFGEMSHGVTRFAHPAQLGLVRGLTLAVHTPSERLTHALELGNMKTELIEGDTNWRDEAFLARMLESARVARGWAEVPAQLVQGRRVACVPSFVPAFGGCYVFPGASAEEPAAWVLCRAGQPEAESWPAQAEAAGVLLLPLTAESAVEFLLARKLVEHPHSGAPVDATELAGLLRWVALDHLHRAGRLTPDTARDPQRAMRSEADAPVDYLELEDLSLRLESRRGPVDISHYSAITRLRVMPLADGEATRHAWVRHLRAFLDPVQVPRTLRDASDLALSVLAQLPPELVPALEATE